MAVTMGAAEGLQMRVRCLQCGGLLEHINGRSNGMLSLAIVGCVECGSQYEVTARITPHRKERFTP
jgi:hypothetical protein